MYALGTTEKKNIKEKKKKVFENKLTFYAICYTYCISTVPLP